MPKTGGFTRYLHFSLPEETYRGLKALAARHGVSVAEVARRLLSEGLAEQAAAEGREAVEKAVRQAIKPAEDRLAALIGKAAHAAATSMFLNAQVLEDLGQRDVVEFYQAARKKAAAYLREKDVKGVGDDED